jgi:1-acyl-sn-glycerol-3-phosphate acyltransferase
MFLHIFGWRTDVVFPHHHIKKYIVIVAPHTSSWDFFVGLAYRSILYMTHTHYLGKKELFKPPLGFIFRWLGGIPVDRTNHHNLVDEVVKIFEQHKIFSLAIAPEGTRKRVEKLKTGFYFMARKANVPIIMVGLDFKNKTVVISNALYPTNDQEHDFKLIHNFYRPIEGKNPENSLGHL